MAETQLGMDSWLHAARHVARRVGERFMQAHGPVGWASMVARWIISVGGPLGAWGIQPLIPGVRNLYPWAFPLIVLAVALSEPTYTDEKQGILKVIALTTHPKMPDSYFPFLIQDFERIAKEQYFDHLLLRVPTRCIRAYKLLLQEKFRIIHSDLRMTLDGYPKIDSSDYIHLDRWE